MLQVQGVARRSRRSYEVILSKPQCWGCIRRSYFEPSTSHFVRRKTVITLMKEVQ